MGTVLALVLYTIFKKRRVRTEPEDEGGMDEESMQCQPPETDVEDHPGDASSGFPATILCGTVNLLAERRIATMATYSPPPSRVDVEEALSSAQEKRARIHEPQHMHSHEIIREWWSISRRLCFTDRN